MNSGTSAWTIMASRVPSLPFHQKQLKIKAKYMKHDFWTLEVRQLQIETTKGERGGEPHDCPQSVPGGSLQVQPRVGNPGRVLVFGVEGSERGGRGHPGWVSQGTCTRGQSCTERSFQRVLLGSWARAAQLTYVKKCPQSWRRKQPKY